MGFWEVASKVLWMWPLTGQTLKPIFGQSMLTGGGGKEGMMVVGGCETWTVVRGELSCGGWIELEELGEMGGG